MSHQARRLVAIASTVAAYGSIALLTSFSVDAQPRRAEPAEVPDAVRLARPSDDEIDAIREAFNEFVESTDRRTRALLERYPGVLEVTMPPQNSAIVPSLSRGFQAKHENNLEVARQGDIELLLMGDSITDFWRNTEGQYAGAAVLDEYFGHWKVANFGIAGDTTQGVLYRLQNGEGEGFSPRAVMLMIGTNNTRANTAAEIAEGIGAVVLELERDFPDAKILLLGVFPRGEPGNPVRDEIAEINERISRLHDGETVHYLDIGDVFLDQNDEIPRSVMSDLLHPSPEGYRLWAEAVQEPLTRLMSAD